jgi:hypothetical protein
MASGGSATITSGDGANGRVDRATAWGLFRVLLIAFALLVPQPSAATTIGWDPPPTGLAITGYQVFVDGAIVETVPATKPLDPTCACITSAPLPITDVTITHAVDVKAYLVDPATGNLLVSEPASLVVPAKVNASPDGTLVPPSTQIVDASGNIWTINNTVLLRNGTGTGGYGTALLWYQGAIYTFGLDQQWWIFGASGWQPYGPNAPNYVPPPPPPPPPPPSCPGKFVFRVTKWPNVSPGSRALSYYWQGQRPVTVTFNETSATATEGPTGCTITVKR